MSLTENTSPVMPSPSHSPFLSAHLHRTMNTLSPKVYPRHPTHPRSPLHTSVHSNSDNSSPYSKARSRSNSLTSVKRIKLSAKEESSQEDIIQGYLKRDAPPPVSSRQDDITKSYMKTFRRETSAEAEPYVKYVQEAYPTCSAPSPVKEAATVVELPPPVPQDSLPNPNSKTLPRQLIYCPTSDLILLVSRLLTSLIGINDESIEKISPNAPVPTSPGSPGAPAGFTRFHSRSPPNISIHSYLLRLSKYSSIPNSILLATIYYIDLLSSKFPAFSLNSLTVHRFLLTATTVGCKGLLDSFATNTHYAKVGGVQVDELNLLEMEFLLRVEWDVVPKQSLQEPSTRFVDVSTAGDVLDIYYRRLIELVGESQSQSELIYTLSDIDEYEYEEAEVAQNGFEGKEETGEEAAEVEEEMEEDDESGSDSDEEYWY